MPDTPDSPRRSRGWFHPWRWRFWLFTMPVLFWAALALLFCWPGLTFKYWAGDWFRLNRIRTTQPTPMDDATFLLGRVAFGKIIGKPQLPDRGFVHINDANAALIAYVWDDGIISLAYWK